MLYDISSRYATSRNMTCQMDADISSDSYCSTEPLNQVSSGTDFTSKSCMLTFLKATVWPPNNTKWLLEVSQLSHFVFGWCIIENYGIGQWLSSVNAGNASPLIWSIECKWYWVGASVGHAWGVTNVQWNYGFVKVCINCIWLCSVKTVTIGLYICA